MPSVEVLRTAQPLSTPCTRAALAAVRGVLEDMGAPGAIDAAVLEVAFLEEPERGERLERIAG